MATSSTPPHPTESTARRRALRRRAPLAVIAGVATTALLAGCAEFGVGLPNTADNPSTRAPSNGQAAASPGTITQQQAAAAALAAVGTGSVTWIGPEDDRGASWEVEVTRPDGTEVDVLVAADGRIITIIDKPGER